jgi:hypothetical protein
MKNIFYVIIILLLVVVVDSCKKSCGINCLHGGSCNGSSCNCPDPYSGYNCDTSCTLGLEGYMCQTLSREKFIGTWNCTSTDQNGTKSTYLITFTDNGYELFMDLNNFNNNGGYPIICTLTGKTGFTIDPTQQDSIATAMGISGSGVWQNGKITINISENNYVTFFATATPQ